MRKQYLIVAATFALCIGISLFVLAMLPPRAGVTKANFDRIEEGMTTEDVERVLGGPGTKFTFFQRRHFFEPDSAEAWGADDRSIVWISYREGSVVEKQWHDSNETILNKIRRWLHLPSP